MQIALDNPHLTGIGFDLPEVRPIFEEYVRRNGCRTASTFQPGDFFNDPLPNADVIMMGHILHDWGLDEEAHADSQGVRSAARRAAR